MYFLHAWLDSGYQYSYNNISDEVEKRSFIVCSPTKSSWNLAEGMSKQLLYLDSGMI